MFYIIPEAGFTGKEYAAIRWIGYDTESDAMENVKKLLRTYYHVGKDNFGRTCFTGINHRGVSSSLAILDASKKAKPETSRKDLKP